MFALRVNSGTPAKQRDRPKAVSLYLPMPGNRAIMPFWAFCEMDSLGVALLVSGMAFLVSGLIFLIPTERKLSSSQENFEESLERLGHHLDEAQRTWRALEDRSAPTEHVPNDRERRDE
jgi:hypothetical protein